MKLADLFARQERTLSLEFFPPKNERGWYTLEDTLSQLAPLGADFVSVTYGAGGSTREKTRDIVVTIQQKHQLCCMAHLTCVNATKTAIAELLDDYHANGIENILALRGDPPQGEERFTPTDGGFAYASDLLAALQRDGRFSTLAAAFPDGHPEAPSREADWDRFIAKLDNGALGGITQCFFTVAAWQEMNDYVQARRPGTRIIPGILPIVDFAAVDRFCTFCQAFIPTSLRAQLEPLSADKTAMRRAGLQWTIDFCRQLLAAGVPGLHIYALNRSTAAAEVVTALRALGSL